MLHFFIGIKKMHIGFLIPLALGLTSGYVSKKCYDEMAYLTVSIAFVSLIISLVIAPWQVQLLLLIFVFISSRQILHQQELRAFSQSPKPLENNANNKPKLFSTVRETETDTLRKYRGDKYPALNNSASKTQAQFIKKYRGLPWSNNQEKEINNKEINSDFQPQALLSTKTNLVDNKVNQDKNTHKLGMRLPWLDSNHITS
jgi:hypothetical protein